MSELARRPASGGGGTRVVLVRQPVRNVSPSGEPSPLPVRLAIGVIAVLGGMGLLWLLGTLGYHLGFARTIGMPGLDAPAGGSIITAIVLLMSVPMTILRAGIAQPLWLMVGFVAIAVPAGAMAAVRPASPGGPRPHVLTVVFSYTSAAAAIAMSVLFAWWVVSPLRGSLLQPFPGMVDDVPRWLADMQLAAGADVLAVVSMGLWVVLAMRVVIPRWLRGLAATATIVAMVIAAAAMAISSGSVSQIRQQQYATTLSDRGDAVLILGRQHDRLAMLSVNSGSVTLHLRAEPEQVRLGKPARVTDFLAQHAE